MTTSFATEIITKRFIKKNKIVFLILAGLDRKYLGEPLSICYPADIDLSRLPTSIVDIPFITNLIPVIWFSGQHYTIKEMDEDLYYSLIKVKEFFKRFFYNTAWNGELKPKRLIKNRLSQTTNQTATCFSGGLDSTTTVFRHFDKHPTLISFNDIHQHAVQFTQSHHLNHVTIYMNYENFLDLTSLDKASPDITKWFWDTTMGLAWVGAAAPFLYAKGISTLYIPSGFTWQSFMFPDGQTLQQPACPLIDENLSPAGLHVHHDSFTMTRTDKIKFISTFCTERIIPKPQLVVCNHHSRKNISYSHCNRCFKCFVTMLDILAIGDNLQEYGFTLSDQEFMTKFKRYMETLTMRRGGTYVAYTDTQRYIKQHRENLPEKYRAFYEWFITIDLESKIHASTDRPLRTVPFNWHDYQDLYQSPIFS